MELEPVVTDVCREKLAQTMRELSSDFDSLTELKAIYPHRIIQAKEFNDKFTADRRAYGVFMGLSAFHDFRSVVKDLLRNSTDVNSKQWADIYIVYLIDSNPKNVEKIQKILKVRPIKHPSIMIALPRSVTHISGHLLLNRALKKLMVTEEDPDLKREWKNRQADLQLRLKELTTWENWSWFYMGGIIEKQDNITESGIISLFLDKIYPRAINPGRRALGCHHRLPKRSRRAVREALRKILDLEKPITISRDKDDLSAEILRQLADMGIMERVSGKGWNEEWALFPQPQNSSPIRPIWHVLSRNFMERVYAGEEISFREINRVFLKAPYGISPALFKVVFALFWRQYNIKLDLYHLGRKKKEKRANLDERLLSQMMRYPDRWTFALKKVSREEKDYLSGMIRIFSPDVKASRQNESPWELARKALLSWFVKIPRIVFQESFNDSRVFHFLDMLAIHRGKDSREIFMKVIPESLGYGPDSVRSPDVVARILSDVSGILRQIDGRMEKVLNDIWRHILGIFQITSENPGREEIDSVMGAWLNRIGADKFHRTYRGDAEALYNVLTDKSTVDYRKRFIEMLPVKMGMGTVMEWETDRSGELVARIEKIKFQMETMEYIALKVTRDSDKKRAYVNRWLLIFFKELGFKPKELESFLEKYIEDTLNR